MRDVILNGAAAWTKFSPLGWLHVRSSLILYDAIDSGKYAYHRMIGCWLSAHSSEYA